MFNPILNQPVYGIVAPTRAIEFSWLDDSVEAQQLLATRIGPLVRGESGDDFAAAEGGFVSFVRDDRLRADLEPDAQGARSRLHRSGSHRPHLPQLLRSGPANSSDHRHHRRHGRGRAPHRGSPRREILGYACRFDPNLNNASDLRTGHIYIEAKFEEAPVFRKATLLSRPYIAAIDDLIAVLSGQSGVLVED